MDLRVSRSRTALATLVAAAVAVVSVAGIAAALTACGARAAGARTASAGGAPKQWDAIAVGAREESVRIIVTHGACGRLRTAVAESEVAVRIEVREEATKGVCTTVAAIQSLTVPLARPLAGRSVLGSHGQVRYPAFFVDRGRVPNLVGFSPGDATDAAALAGLRIHVRHVSARFRFSRVLAQYPGPGQPFPGSGVVRVAVAGG